MRIKHGWIFILYCIQVFVSADTATRSLRDHDRLSPHDELVSQTMAVPSEQDPMDDGLPLSYDAWRTKPGFPSAEPTQRSTITSYGARVACWPRSGGVWIKQADMVEMNFLGLDRRRDAPRDPYYVREDKFCTKLKMIGAEWWPLPPPFEQRIHLGKEQFACETLESCFEPEDRSKYLIAWPENDNVACYIGVEEAKNKNMSMGVRHSMDIYRNVMNMDERCASILRLGGKRCRCKAECPDIKDWDWGFRDREPWGCHDAPSIYLHPKKEKPRFERFNF